MNKDADKGVGLAKLAQYCNIGKKEIIAFGDGENDIEMLEYAGLSIVPSNAKDKAKDAADLVLERDNNQSAVAHFLEKLF